MKNIRNAIRAIRITNISMRVLLVILVIFIILLVSIHILVNIKGKSLLINKLEETFNRKAKIGSLTTSFPVNLHVKNIEVEGLFSIDEVSAGGGVFDIFRKSFNLSSLKVVRPVVTIEKSFIPPVAQVFSIPAKDLTSKTDIEGKSENENTPTELDPLALTRGRRFLFPRFSINHLFVYDGVINFLDKSFGDKEILIKIKDLNIKADNLNLSRFGNKITSFEIKGKMPWGQGQAEGRIEAEGWLNFFKKDMQASLKIEDIDGVYLYPYYSNWVDLEKARIEKARLNFTSNIQGLNNNVTADCHLELTDIVRKPRPPEESEEKAEKITNVVLDIFRALNQGKITLNFTIRTKMDKPEFGFSNIKMAFEDKLAQGRKANGFKVGDVLKLPANLLQGTVESATDLTRAVINGAVSVGKELKKAVEETFRREPEESKENKE